MAERVRGGIVEPEEDGFDLMRVGRAAAWAVIAVLAVSAALAAAKSESGARRLYAALEGLPAPLRPVPPAGAKQDQVAGRAGRNEADAQALAETVHVLAADRDRLLARVEALERNLDVTGSIGPRAGAPAAVAAAPATPATGSPAPPATALLGTAATESVAVKTEFAIDLGTDVTVDGLRALWQSLKAQHGGLLEGLRPLIAIRESGKPGGVDLRLVAGPLANAAAAARLCAAMAPSGSACQPAMFEGQRLALR